MNLLLLPGTLCDAAVWAPVIAGLSGLASCTVGDVGRHDTIEAIAAALLAEHPGKLAVAGFSFGGFVAMRMAAVAPERVTGLALIGTVAWPLPIEQHALRRERLAAAETQGVGAYVRALIPAYLHPDSLAAAAHATAIIGMAERLGVAVLRRQVAANIARPDARPTLAGLRVPVMVLCGAADATCHPEDHRAIAAAVSGAALTEVGGAGHFVTLEQPEAVIAAMRAWLGRVAPQT